MARTGGAGTIDTEEHLHGENEQPRKSVGLFARDGLGTGTFELSAISTASGAVLSTTPASISAVGVTTVFIGTPTLFAVVNTAAAGNTNALATLLSGPNQIGSVTVSNFVSPNLGNVTLNPGPSQIGSVTVPHTVSVQGDIAHASGDAGNPVKVGGKALPQTALTSTASGNRVNAWFDNTGLLGTFGFMTIYPRTDYLGLMSISGNVAVSSLPALAAGTAQIGSVTISNTPNVVVTGGLISLASGTEIRGLVTILPRTDYIGLMSVSGNVVASQTGNWDIRSALSLASIYGKVAVDALPVGTSYFGLVTNTPARTMSTSFATVVSGAGNYTIFVPPSGKRWFMHNVMVNSMGVSEGTLKSGTALRWPWAGLATYGGFAKTFDNPGLPATAVDDALVVTLNSAATISFEAAIHFE